MSSTTRRAKELREGFRQEQSEEVGLAWRLGAVIGVLVGGFAGCASDVGLVNGLFFGGSGGAIVGIVWYVISTWGSVDDKVRRQIESDAAQKAAAEAAARAAGLAKLRQLADGARGAAESLPIILGESELTLDRAQEELKSQLPSPFWEAMEEAVSKLSAFGHALSIIEANRAEYRAQSAQVAGDVPPFTLGVSVLPHPAATQSRLTSLYRQAQSIPHFSIIYEQRRTTATLIEGFRSLGQAIEGLGDRIVSEIGSLAASVDCRLASLESSLESSAAAAAEQSAALRAQVQNAAGANDALRGQLRQDAEARSETEHLALRMLDNIQRKRKPTIFERP